MGAFYFNGKAVDPDYEKAVEYFGDGCALRDRMSCYLLARMSELIENYEGAASFHKKSCNLQFAPSCISMANLYEHGLGVEQNDDKAAEYYAKGTELMTSEERQKFFSLRLEQNKEARSQQEKLQQMQAEIELLRSFNLDNEFSRNILQLQGNTN